MKKRKIQQIHQNIVDKDTYKRCEMKEEKWRISSLSHHDSVSYLFASQTKEKNLIQKNDE